MDEMLRKENVLKALSAKIDELEKRDAKADVILGLATAMSVVKLMGGEPAEKEKSCADCISRQAAIYVINHAQVNFSVESEIDFTKHEREVHEIIENVLGTQEKALKQLPPVNSTEKVGRWIDHQEDRWIYAKCSECNTVHDARTNYCPNCGAKMGGEQNV